MLNHKKVFKTTYFIARKKQAVQENFADIIDFLKDIGDEDIPKAFSWVQSDIKLCFQDVM